MRKGLFWLNDKQWAQIEPHLPTNQTGPARDDDRRIISGIIHMLQCGARWRDCPPDYGPYTTIYNRFNRWAKRGHWQAIFEALARCGKDGVTLSIDSTSIKAHRSASGGKGGRLISLTFAGHAGNGFAVPSGTTSPAGIGVPLNCAHASINWRRFSKRSPRR